MSQNSYNFTWPYWDQIGSTIVGRYIFDMQDGRDGTPPGAVGYMIVVTHRPRPEGGDPEAPFHTVDGIGVSVATAQESAGERSVKVSAGEAGGPALHLRFQVSC